MTKGMMAGAAIALMAMAPAIAAPVERAAPVTAQADARIALGREIAQLLNSEAITIAQTRRMFDETMPGVFAQDPNLGAMEKQYPGIIRHMIDAMRPEILRNVTSELPELWDRLAPIYAGALTEAEMRESLAFYRSPTGVWLIDTMANNADFSSALGRVVTDPNREITAADLKAGAVDSTIGAVAGGMTAERGRAIMAFHGTSAGQKMRALQPKLLEVSAAWSNETDPAAEARVQKIVQDAVLGYMAQRGAKP